MVLTWGQCRPREIFPPEILSPIYMNGTVHAPWEGKMEANGYAG